MNDTSAKHFNVHTETVGDAERPNMWRGFSEAEFWRVMNRLCNKYVDSNGGRVTLLCQ